MKMRCSKCGVVFEGPVDKCPNCGVVFKKPAAAPAANPAPAEESKPGNSVVVNVYNGNTNNGNAPAEEVKKSYWDGHLIQLIGWQLLTGFLVLITLGIMVPWRVCKLHGWHCKHSVYDGYRLTFDGHATQLIGKWILWMLLCIITIFIYAFFLPMRIEAWKAKHTHLVVDKKTAAAN